MKRMKHREYGIEEQPCPHCGHSLQAASPFNGKDIRISAGDLTLCLYCAVILRFREDGLLEIVPLDDMRQMVEEHPEDSVYIARAWYATKQRLTSAATRIH